VLLPRPETSHRFLGHGSGASVRFEVLGTMSLSQNEMGNVSNMPSMKPHELGKPDLKKVGENIYALLNVPPKKKQVWKKQSVAVEIKPDHLYGPKEVSAVLGVSYDTAIRTMQRMKRTANLAKLHAKKRLLRVKGSDLRTYIQDKLES
jgi:hypothetical protein